MSYTYHSALIRKKGFNARWEAVNIANVVISTLLSENKDVIVTLENTILAGLHSFWLTENRALITNPNHTVSQWLVDNGNITLPTEVGYYDVSRVRARYKDARQAGYIAKMVHPTAHPAVVFPESDLRDILLSQSSIDYDLLHKHAMVSVNGFFHLTQNSTHGLYVKEAGTTIRKSNSNNIGILSTVDIGELTYIPITEDMVYVPEGTYEIGKTPFINVGMDLDTVSVLLCVGGYLHVLDNTYRAIGNGQIKLDLWKINVHRRLLESREFIDVDAIIDYVSDGDIFYPDRFLTEEFVKSYLTLPQSFIVVINATNITTRKKGLEPTALPGLSIAHHRPEDLCFYRHGRGAVYRTYNDWGRWVLNHNAVLDPHYQFETTDYVEQGLFNDSLSTQSVNRLAYTHLLEIGRENITLKVDP